jgi:hypothetical protein
MKRSISNRGARAGRAVKQVVGRGGTAPRVRTSAKQSNAARRNIRRAQIARTGIREPRSPGRVRPLRRR